MMPAPHNDPLLKCGSCKWFSFGFRGNNCKITRGVKKDTQACIEYEAPAESFFVKVGRVDKFLQGIFALLEDPAWDIDPIVHKEVAHGLAEVVKIKDEFTLNDPDCLTNKEDLQRLARCFKTVQAFKDRVSTIQMDAMRPHKKLSRLMEDAEAYLYANFPDQLMSLKNKDDRGRMVRFVLRPLVDKIEMYDDLLESCELINKNLQEAHFSLCRIESLSKTINESNRTAWKV